MLTHLDAGAIRSFLGAISCSGLVFDFFVASPLGTRYTLPSTLVSSGKLRHTSAPYFKQLAAPYMLTRWRRALGDATSISDYRRINGPLPQINTEDHFENLQYAEAYLKAVKCTVVLKISAYSFIFRLGIFYDPLLLLADFFNMKRGCIVILE